MNADYSTPHVHVRRCVEEAAAGDEYGSALRARARAEAEVLRRRLAEGDFRVGDRIQVQVAGENWNASSPGAVQNTVQVPTPGAPGVPSGRGSVGATFTVQTGPAVKVSVRVNVSVRVGVGLGAGLGSARVRVRVRLPAAQLV